MTEQKINHLTLFVVLLSLCSMNMKAQFNNNMHCPDNLEFPAVNIKSWNTVPVVNGRLPNKEEALNGTSLIYFDKKKWPDAKPYAMTLPKLASFFNPNTKRKDTVIVIQIVQTREDTVVGYRYLTGGNGSHNFRDFHFLTEKEINIATHK